MDEVLTAVRTKVERIEAELQGLSRDHCISKVIAELAQREARTRALIGYEGSAEKSAAIRTARHQFAVYLLMVWGDAGKQYYEPWAHRFMTEMAENAIRAGHHNESAFDRFAVWNFSGIVLDRIARAADIKIDDELEQKLRSEIGSARQDYLKRAVDKLKYVHWIGHHHPDCAEAEEMRCEGYPVGYRNETDVEKHLDEMAVSAMAPYVIQRNIAHPHGNLENPYDHGIVLRDMVSIQEKMGRGKSEETWNEAALHLANRIDSRFGNSEKRELEESIRRVWVSLSQIYAGRACTPKNL